MYSPRSVSTTRTAGGFERVVEADLLGQHRLRLCDELRVRAAADLGDVGVRVGGRARKVDMAAARLERGSEAGHVRVEVVDHAHPRIVGTLPERLDLGDVLPRFRPVAVKTRRRRVERALRVSVGELEPCNLTEPPRRLRELGHRANLRATTARPGPVRAPPPRSRVGYHPPPSCSTIPLEHACVCAQNVPIRREFVPIFRTPLPAPTQFPPGQEATAAHAAPSASIPRASAVARWTTRHRLAEPRGSAAEMHQAAWIGADERVGSGRGRPGELVVRHRDGHLRLAHRERAAEPAAEVGPRERRRARRPSARAAAAARRRCGARAACGTSRGRRSADPRSAGRARLPARRGTRTAPRRRTARSRRAPGRNRETIVAQEPEGVTTGSLPREGADERARDPARRQSDGPS